ncbi:MAG: hypothetical protein M1829_001855 [Trizodia sp. TS-e1964]|nr:MAG: hypothetical protein M1829_001855 [Trizodia sp. TS-e1964]
MATRPHCLGCSKRLAKNPGIKCHCARLNAACGYCSRLHKKWLEALLKPDYWDVEKLANYQASYTSRVEAYISRVPRDNEGKALLELQKLTHAVRKLTDVLVFNFYQPTINWGGAEFLPANEDSEEEDEDDEESAAGLAVAKSGDEDEEGDAAADAAV